MPNKKKMLSRRMTVFVWLLAIGGIIGTLISFEQISVLYVLTTLSLVVLLLVVGFSDLEGAGRGDEEINAKT